MHHVAGIHRTCEIAIHMDGHGSRDMTNRDLICLGGDDEQNDSHEIFLGKYHFLDLYFLERAETASACLHVQRALDVVPHAFVLILAVSNGGKLLS